MPGEASAARADRRAQLGLFAFAAVVYLATYRTGHDGVLHGNDVFPYARDLAAGEAHGLWNPHHLLLHPLALLAGRAWCLVTGADWGVPAALAGHRVVAALGGALAVAVVFGFARRVAPRGVAVPLTAAFAVSAGQWLYSAVGETYVPMYAVCGWLLARAAEDRLGLRPVGALAMGALLLVATLLRQDAVLVVPALLLVARPRPALVAVLAAGAASLALHGVGYGLSGSELGFVPWLRGLAETGTWGHAPDLFAVKVHLALIGAAFAYGVYFAWVPWKLTLGIVGLVALAVACAPRRRPGPAATRVALALLVYVAARSAFFVWWQPGNMEFTTGAVMPVFLGAAVLLGPAERAAAPARRALLAVAALVLLVGNAVVLVAPGRGEALDDSARAAAAAAGEEGLVVALDHLMAYALARAEPTCQVVDAQPLAVGWDGNAPAALVPHMDHLMAARARALDAGAAVVLVRDPWYAPLYWNTDPPVQAPLVAALTAGCEATEVTGDDGEPLLLVLWRTP